MLQPRGGTRQRAPERKRGGKWSERRSGRKRENDECMRVSGEGGRQTEIAPWVWLLAQWWWNSRVRLGATTARSQFGSAPHSQEPIPWHHSFVERRYKSFKKPWILKFLSPLAEYLSNRVIQLFSGACTMKHPLFYIQSSHVPSNVWSSDSVFNKIKFLWQCMTHPNCVWMLCILPRNICSLFGSRSDNKWNSQ